MPIEVTKLSEIFVAWKSDPALPVAAAFLGGAVTLFVQFFLQRHQDLRSTAAYTHRIAVELLISCISLRMKFRELISGLEGKDKDDIVELITSFEKDAAVVLSIGVWKELEIPDSAYKGFAIKGTLQRHFYSILFLRSIVLNEVEQFKQTIVSKGYNINNNNIPDALGTIEMIENSIFVTLRIGGEVKNMFMGLFSWIFRIVEPIIIKRLKTKLKENLAATQIDQKSLQDTTSKQISKMLRNRSQFFWENYYWVRAATEIGREIKVDTSSTGPKPLERLVVSRMIFST